MAIAAFLDKYFECVEYLPLDLQRCVTRLRAVDMEARGVVEDLKRLKTELHRAIQQNNAEQQTLLFRQLQETLLIARDLGNRKLTISAHMLEIAEEYEQQLQQKQKAVDHSSTDEFYHAHRLSSGAKEYASDTKPSSKRSTGNKRVRTHNPPPEPMDEDSNNGRSKDSLPQTNNTALSNGRSAKKKVKTIKKKTGSVNVKMSADESPPAIPAVPMPDLTSQPLDPDEPTYCLCQQVSFGEMIGCDNEECPIEWFHFQCVNLTSKPKGKWYCPQCSQGRKNSKPTK